VFSSTCALLRRLALEEAGQDVIEYAFVAAGIGIAGALIITNLPQDIGNTYSSWTDPTNGVPSLWDPPDPAGSGS
jgi:Flp pilus assembly pilin Flp